MKASPCKGCPDRTLTCHSVCRRYEDWKIEKAAENDYLREMNKVDVSDSVVRRHWKNQRYGSRVRSKVDREGRR